MSISSSDYSNANDSGVLKSNFICVLSIIFYAMGFPAAEYLLDDWDVVSIIAARNTSAFVLIFFIWILYEGFQEVRVAKWIKGFWIGAIGFGIGSFFVLLLQSLTTPVIAALMVATMPVAAVTLEIFLDGRKMTKWFLFGVVLVLIGGFIASGANLKSDNIGFASFLGITGVGLFAWGSRATVKNLPGMSLLGQVAVTTSGMVGSAILVYFISRIFFDISESPSQITYEHLGLLLIYACLAIGISQILWLKSVAHLGIGLSSFHLNAAPFYVMLMLFLLGKNWVWHQALGAVIVIIGVIIAQRKSINNKAEFLELP
ncbi:DMT family transporter [Candidatus Pseudothioglobus singularis]|jgi:drug/metabolite transporter (DMT)-like permease|nr:DMT family transporter [Candidatus Pseudothioglobus singularis]MDA7440930.1 DMT family transporter [Candidatus Pseudothioglobus singularis]MDB4821902.1 DMT family transporter [Candidatus Pseudothioglobus singularis]MDC0469899.1 DMT family transporter [Candidatus Pseudothioglobus singularis]MDC0553288.1 DMT family transporter [Candidatus Pseudothioglobus singularis]MDC0597058.1 DMT family transporter [Candidatus Pseudothioglobus singularis]|tara:strand:+ start:928 stop:1875 length:948 start_codon:yes stop_codon:yes gene_type:complete